MGAFGTFLGAFGTMSFFFINFAEKILNTMELPITQERNKAIRSRFDAIMRCTCVNQKYVNRQTILDLMMESPAPRFYIDAKQAERYVIAYYKCKDVSSFRKSHDRQEMMKDLVDAFEKIRPEHMDMKMVDIWEMVVNSPAKSFYISRRTMKRIVFNYIYKPCKRN